MPVHPQLKEHFRFSTRLDNGAAALLDKTRFYQLCMAHGVDAGHLPAETMITFVRYPGNFDIRQSSSPRTYITFEHPSKARRSFRYLTGSNSSQLTSVWLQ